MIGSVSSSRRANAFAQALDERDTGGAGVRSEDSATGVPADRSGPAEEREQALMLTLAEGLGGVPRPELAEEVKTVQRAQLVAAMEAQFASGASQVPAQRDRSRKGSHRATPLSPLGRLRPRSRLTKGLAAGGLTVGVAAGAFSGVAAASTDALPGDTLYGLKRGMEDLKLDLAGGDAERGVVHLDHASTRMHEARRLMERGKSGPLDHESLAEVRKALNAMWSNASEGHRLLNQAHARDGRMGPLQSLSAFTQSHRKGWGQLRAQLPVQLKDVSDQVSSLFEAMEEDASPLESLLPSEGSGERTPDRAPGVGNGTGEEPGDGPSAVAPDGRPSDGRTTGTEQPGSTKPEQKESGGLVGGAGGLLDPPAKEAPSESGGKEKEGEKEPYLPAPDITLPPLLPGGLPGLGLETGDN
ncbi:DUF5667 domain-containing protein [Streptomyces sp. 549]|uniref:DUF5667 domain-containing protein n=1 Tax=Streptomyces sp. 549 TaxID=3049076 RepID=UPI0024C4503B|nr:DUF5667 domain-containing protein [Streptomyces sp. 549]MDK1475397.1 DUF5667 domain-containing protein [Streptomyces sp. 549]